MSGPSRKSIARSVGEFVGHIVHAVRTDPARPAHRRTTVEERREGSMTLRRTTIEEIEFKDGSDEG